MKTIGPDKAHCILHVNSMVSIAWLSILLFILLMICLVTIFGDFPSIALDDTFHYFKGFFIQWCIFIIYEFFQGGLVAYCNMGQAVCMTAFQVFQFVALGQINILGSPYLPLPVCPKHSSLSLMLLEKSAIEQASPFR